MKYRKKPVVIEAFKWTGDINQIEEPKWILKAIEEESVWFSNVGCEFVEMIIEDSNGVLSSASRGDYIIKGIKGELYPCKPDIFEMTYECIECPDCELSDKENHPCQFNNRPATIEEYCPSCCGEITLTNKFEVQKCPTCGLKMFPCSICTHDNNYMKCDTCPLEK